MQNDILRSTDERNCVALLLLDLSAAVDTVDHSILLSRLRHRFGIDGKALKWLHSYINNRSQFVCVGNGYSSRPRARSTLQSSTRIRAGTDLILRVRFFKKIQDWILKSQRIRKRILRFFSRVMLRQRNPRIHPGSGFFGSFDAP